MTTENPVFMYEELLELVMNDTEIAHELLKEFKVQTNKHMELLADYVAQLNTKTDLREQIKKTAHLLKGSALNIRAPHFAECMRVIEHNALDLSVEEVNDFFKRAEDARSALYQEIDALAH